MWVLGNYQLPCKWYTSHNCTIYLEWHCNVNGRLKNPTSRCELDWISKFCAALIFMGATSRNLNITSFYQLVSYLKYSKIMDMAVKNKIRPDILKQKPFLENDGLLLGCGIWMWADVAAHHVIRQHLILPRLVRMLWQHEATDSGSLSCRESGRLIHEAKHFSNKSGVHSLKDVSGQKYASIASLLFISLSFLKNTLGPGLLNHEHQVIKQHQPTTTTSKFCYVHTYGTFIQVPVFASIICTPCSGKGGVHENPRTKTTIVTNPAPFTGCAHPSKDLTHLGARTWGQSDWE